MKILGVVLARKNSKRLPNKNIKLLYGKPLIEYTIDAAIESGVIDTLVVSTDDENVKKICHGYNKRIVGKLNNDNKIYPHWKIKIIDRPSYLATDKVTSEECISHIMDQVEKHDYIILLQVTSPLRTALDIIKFLKSNSDYSVSTKDAKCNGAIYGCGWDDFRSNKKFNYKEKYFMTEACSIDIDTELDFKIAEMLIKGNK